MSGIIPLVKLVRFARPGEEWFLAEDPTEQVHAMSRAVVEEQLEEAVDEPARLGRAVRIPGGTSSRERSVVETHTDHSTPS